MRDLRNNRHPRAFIQEMLHLARAANFGSLDSRLLIIWNHLDVSLRRDILEPTKSTSLGQFLEQIDSKTAIWYELAHRPSYHYQQSNQQSNQQSTTRPFKPRPPQESRAYVADPDDYEDDQDEH